MYETLDIPNKFAVPVSSIKGRPTPRPQASLNMSKFGSPAKGKEK
jgi:hypothetical protein